MTYEPCLVGENTSQFICTRFGGFWFKACLNRFGRGVYRLISVCFHLHTKHKHDNSALPMLLESLG